jgi:chromate transporter
MISFADARKMWFRVGLLSFGGPAGQIALLHKEVIDQRQLISEKEFLSALNFCMLLPGPEAMQLATYIGWKLHGLKGGLTAGLLFVLPGAITLYVLSALYVLFGKMPLVEALFWGVKSAVVVVVIEALLRVSKRALKGHIDYLIAGLAFVALFCFALPFPLIVAAAALFGYLWSDGKSTETTLAQFPSTLQTLKRLAAWLAVWFAPLTTMVSSFGRGQVYSELAMFFSKLSVVTFGGAYAVLSYMGQDVVEAHQWLTAPQMMDGLGLAETTPGPLILVGQFVGFLAAHKAEGTLLSGFLGGAIFLWMTFVPCFLWIFVGAPYVEYLQSNARLSSALAKITAAVVGVILNLSLWFGLHVLFGQVQRLSGPLPMWWPNLSGFDAAALVLAIVAGLALLRFHLGMVKTLALAAGLGIIWKIALPHLIG